ncbi:MAG: hypothetical protein E7626_01320 [Ruminococcaceae bacterium]|nr:hypothetical protein [Oscillospiraceae bacterium]
MEFKIGDRIQVKDSGMKGEVVDRFFSELQQEYVYRIKLDGFSSPERFMCDGDNLIPEVIEPETTYHFEFEILENLVSARFYEDKGDKTSLICRGHGHIFHDGAVGVAQAASYALKKILEKLNDGYYDLRKTVIKEKRK